jgi:hypothetical protein
MPTTFITGSSGFVGATILDRLLASKYKVVGAFRSKSSAAKLFSVNPQWDQSLITVVEIPDFSKADAFDAVFKNHPDIDSVIHVAAAGLSGPTTDFVEHFEKPTVHGQLSLLESVHKYGKKVKAISVTGSINAITTGAQDDIKSRAITSSEWLPMGRNEAIEMQHPFVSIYVVLDFLHADSLDFVLRFEEAGGRSHLGVCQDQESDFYRHSVQPSTHLGPNATEHRVGR